MNDTLEKTCSGTPALDIAKIRADFPILSRTFYGKPLAYLDNGATTHKPQAVIDRISYFYAHEYGTVRRGVYALSEGATDAYQHSRETIARFLNARESDEILITSGATDSINLAAWSYGMAHLEKGDIILASAMEHHANIVPWQQLCERTGAQLRVIPMNARGELMLDAYEALLAEGQVKIVAVAHVSNTLGTINPVRRLVELAHAAGAVVLVDGAQAAPHLRVDVQALDCDFYAFSGHKIYGPTGVGILYARRSLQDAMIPYRTGGDMIETVSFERVTFAEPPRRFEAGTPPIAQLVGLAAAIEYVQRQGLDAIAAYEHRLLRVATERLCAIEGLRILGEARMKASLISFVVDGAHALDLGTLLDLEGIAIRTGHHCAQPVMKAFDAAASARASFAFYNTEEEIHRFADALTQAIAVCRGDAPPPTSTGTPLS
ncbi:MAG: SufS family cysteine desulfurase [Vampirovibrionales bacterium]|nr:SufS family cysteine desulfurase [Vampirovibrionales bacterium]